MSDGSTSDEHPQVNQHQLKVNADVGDISSFAESDEEEQDTMSATEQKKWADIYLAKYPDRNVRKHSVAFLQVPAARGGRSPLLKASAS